MITNHDQLIKIINENEIPNATANFLWLVLILLQPIESFQIISKLFIALLFCFLPFPTFKHNVTSETILSPVLFFQFHAYHIPVKVQVGLDVAFKKWRFMLSIMAYNNVSIITPPLYINFNKGTSNLESLKRILAFGIQAFPDSIIH